LTPDFPKDTKIPVNIETTLNATIKDSSGLPPSTSIAVRIETRWESKIVYSEPNTGKVRFTLKPPSSYNKEPQTITFSSDAGYFETVTTTVICVPAVIVQASYAPIQHYDPIEGKDIVLNLTAVDSEHYSTIITPSMWEVVKVETPSGTTALFLPPYEVATGVYQLSIDVTPNTINSIYKITVKAYYEDYIAYPSTFEVLLQAPIIVVKYVFATGESITITPENSGSGLEVKKGCQYFDMYFYDFQNRPVKVNALSNDFDIVITSSTAQFRKNYGVTVEQISDNCIRVYFPLEESWYIITPTITAFIGAEPVTATQNELKVATVRMGFNILDFILSIWFMIPLAILAILVIVKLARRKKGNE